MRDRSYFAAYSGGECILKCQGRKMIVTTVTTPDMCRTGAGDRIHVNYIDDDGNSQDIILSANAVWTLEVEQP